MLQSTVCIQLAGVTRNIMKNESEFMNIFSLLDLNFNFSYRYSRTQSCDRQLQADYIHSKNGRV